jgi:hypothetical protein
MYEPPAKPGASPSEVHLPSGHRTVYIEEATPAGRVPPPSKSSVAPATQQAMTKAAQTPSQLAASAVEAAQGTIQRFSKAYADKGSPRIAIFLNRALSDDVREWQSDARVAAAYEQRGITQLTEKTHVKETSAIHSNVTAASVIAIEQPTESADTGVTSDFSTFMVQFLIFRKI